MTLAYCKIRAYDIGIILAVCDPVNRDKKVKNELQSTQPVVLCRLTFRLIIFRKAI